MSCIPNEIKGILCTVWMEAAQKTSGEISGKSKNRTSDVNERFGQLVLNLGLNIDKIIEN